MIAAIVEAPPATERDLENAEIELVLGETIALFGDEGWEGSGNQPIFYVQFRSVAYAGWPAESFSTLDLAIAHGNADVFNRPFDVSVQTGAIVWLWEGR